jgi:uncharacterized protein YndB with AHSA1/START domain
MDGPVCGTVRHSGRYGAIALMPGLVIEREVVIEAPVEVVWRTVTEPDQLSQWFARPGGARRRTGRSWRHGVRGPGRPCRRGDC